MEKLPNFSFITKTEILSMGDNRVEIRREDGTAEKLMADTVVFSGGMKSRTAEALKFYGCAHEFRIIGDCDKVGNVQKCTCSAFAAASNI